MASIMNVGRATVAGLMVLAGTTAAWGVPTQWTFKVVARTGGAGTAFGVPANATFLESGVPNELGLDQDGSLAIRYLVNVGQLNRYDAYLVYDAASMGTYSILEPTQGGLYSSSMDMLNGKIAITYTGLVAGGEVRDELGTLETPIALGGPLQLYGSITNMRLRSDGAVAYRATMATSPTNPSTTTKIAIDRVVDGVRVQTALADSSIAGGFSMLYSPATSDNGLMAAKVQFRSNNSYGVVRFEEGQSPVTMFNIGGAWDTLGDVVNVNNAGRVAFFARNASPLFTWELMTTDGSTVRSIAKAAQWPAVGIANSAFNQYVPQINSGGLVAYRADLTVSPLGTGVFVSDGVSTHRVIGQGSTVVLPSGGQAALGQGAAPNTTTVVGNIVMNDAGQIAFIGKFADATLGLIIATPVVERCSPADVADDQGTVLPSGGVNTGVNEGDYNAFFQGFFDAAGYCDIADDAGHAPPSGVNTGVNEGDYNAFFQVFFDGCL